MRPEDIFAELHRAASTACGARLFTVTVLDRAAGVARRAYTSHPDDYPATGTKPMGTSAWTQQVIARGETFVANTTSGFSPFFSDHALINELGCEAAINIPITRSNQVVGTVNILDEAEHFTPERVKALERIVEERRVDLLRALADTPMQEQS
ncbi:MAG: GAF domain-containing protein [Boseongicola sp.]